jgi:probable F420-dependent oxidoreductase
MPIVDLAIEIESRGFGGLFLNEHPHFPIDRPSTPDPAGRPVAERYWRFWDPYIALSFVAAHTSLEVGPFISLIGEHDAIALSKGVATLDVLSGGRLTLGVGFGWHREEFEDHGWPAHVRADVVEEKIQLMREMWVKEESSFEGQYVRVSRCHAYPKPAQKPHPPILLGARGTQRNFDRILRWADGWIPQASGRRGIMDIFDPDLEPSLTELRRSWSAAQKAGTPQITVILFSTPVGDLARAYDRAAQLDIDRICVHLPDEGREILLPLLDDMTRSLGTALR